MKKTNVHRVLDRIAMFDDRSRDYPIRALLRADAKPRSYTWACAVHLDQGAEGACTGFAVSQEAAARPKVVSGITDEIGRVVYRRAQQIDEWPGENYEGSSVLAAVKAGTERKWYSGYRWAFGEGDLSLAVGHYGPAVLGVNWYTSMFSPNAQGLIKIGGIIEGGHAILCNGYNAKAQMYRLHNSWGANWGVRSACYIRAADIVRLLAEDGEACVPTRLAVK